MIASNPVLWREIISTMRSRRGVVIQVLFVAMLAGLTLVSWPTGGTHSLEALETTRLFTTIAVAEVFLMAFASTAFSSVAFTVERQRNTLDLVYTTHLTPFEIVLGKLFSSIAFLLMLGLLGVPMLVAAYSLGGTELTDVFKVCLVLVTSGVLFGSLGLLVSSLCSRNFTAVVWSFVMLVTLLVGLGGPALFARYVPGAGMSGGATHPAVSAAARRATPAAFDWSSLMPWLPLVALGLIAGGVAAWLYWNDRRETRPRTAVAGKRFAVVFAVAELLLWGGYLATRSKVVLGWASSISPIPAVLGIASPNLFQAYDLPEINYFAAHLVMAGVVSAALFSITCWIMTTPGGHKPRTRNDVIRERNEALKRMVKFPYRLIDPQRRRRMIGRIFNLIFIKELRTKALGKAHYLVRGIYACIAVSIGLVLAMTFLVDVFDPAMHRVAVTVLQLLLVLFLTPALSATAITSEREGGHLDQLRSADVGGYTMLMGKLLSSLVPMGLLLLATLPILAGLVFVAQEGAMVLKGLATIGVALLFSSVAGLFFSSLVKKTATAVAATYVTVLLFGIGTYAIIFLADTLEPTVVGYLLSLNVLAGGVAAVSENVIEYKGVWFNNLVFLGSVTVLMFIVAAWRVRRLLGVQR